MGVVLVYELGLAVLLREEVSLAIAYLFVFGSPIGEVLLQEVHDELRLGGLLLVDVGNVALGFVETLFGDVHGTFTLLFLFGLGDFFPDVTINLVTINRKIEVERKSDWVSGSELISELDCAIVGVECPSFCFLNSVFSRSDLSHVSEVVSLQLEEINLTLRA